MPNVKIYVDERHSTAVAPKLTAALPGLRALLCGRLAVEASACQIAVLSVLGLEDQPQVNAELLILPRPERTAERIRAVAEDVRAHLGAVTGLHVAVRIAMLNPATYQALK